MTDIRIKRRLTGAAGAPSTLKNAELGFNEVNDVLYYGKGINAGNAATVEAIAGKGAFTNLADAQTVSGEKTFSGGLKVTTVDADFGSRKLTNLGTPIADADATNKLYVDTAITDVISYVDTEITDAIAGIGVAGGDVDGGAF